MFCFDYLILWNIIFNLQPYTEEYNLVPVQDIDNCRSRVNNAGLDEAYGAGSDRPYTDGYV